MSSNRMEHDMGTVIGNIRMGAKALGNIRCVAFLLFLLSQLFVLPISSAQPHARWEKLSPMLRQLVRQEGISNDKSRLNHDKHREVCAFVRVSNEPEKVLRHYGCRELARVGGISIASIPVASLRDMSLDERIKRIEASPSGRVLNDSMAIHLNAVPVYKGTGLPQAYTGKGVVMGLMDIGFDLTHPNFYDSTATNYRIRQFWDMISADTIGSQLYVGRDYTTQEELLALGHSRDGLDFTHGTHTLGIAAGGGYQSAYQGMAPESDICIVANAVSDDLPFIDPADYEKYTYATDALGFKYIFDYAERMGQPCVISFSEGSSQDFWGYDQLYYELIDSLLGPGRILVSAAGNRGDQKFWFKKPAGQISAGTFLFGNGGQVDGTLKGDAVFDIRIVGYGSKNDTLTINTVEVFSRPDSLWTDTLELQGLPVVVVVEAYPSCYVAQETCFDVMVRRLTPGSLGSEGSCFVSLEMVGEEANVEFWKYSAWLVESELNPSLCCGDGTHSIMSPASSPSVICVGSTYYRQGITNYRGEWTEHERARRGYRVNHSSRGPTMDGRMKPDVMAPGANIISSNSSFFMENHPETGERDWTVEFFDFQGRTYAWTANTGTSSASPAVGGAIALWLQANPQLTPTDVMGIIERTSTHPDPSLTYPNNDYGYGQIDVYRGLLDILDVSAIDDISKSHTPASISVTNNQLYISLGEPTVADFTVRLYSLKGQLLIACRLNKGQKNYHLPLPQLLSGIYALQIDGQQQVAGSSLIRL